MEIITRAAWGARYQNGAYYQDASGAWRPVILPLPFSEWWAHHSVTAQLPPSATLEQEAAAMRAIEQIGQDRFGQGISYTYLVFPSGRPFEGHGLDRRGAHTYGHNDVGRAICFAGDYSQHRPTAAQLRTAAQLLQIHHDRGYCQRRSYSGGHRDLKATACPGDHYYAALDGINQLAAGPPITEETDDMFTADDRAKLDRVHTELTQPLGSRSDYATEPRTTDTMAGWAVNADAQAHAVRVELLRARAALEARVAAVEQRLDALPEQLGQVVRQAMADVVDVRVSVVDGDPVGS